MIADPQVPRIDRDLRRMSWAPITIIVLAQILLVFNITALKVSIDGLSSTFGTSASSVKTAIVLYSLVVAALITLGARLRERLGARTVFRSTLVLFAVAMLMMAACRGLVMIWIAQALAGAASAAMVPALVVLVGNHYSGERLARAMGWLGAAQAIGIVPSLIVSGVLAQGLGWRYTYGLLAIVAIVAHTLSAMIRSDPPRTVVSVDKVGVLLASCAIFLIGIGCNNLADWGLWTATARAPFNVLTLSPAPVFILFGMVLFQAFLVWSLRFQASGGTPLVSLDILRSREERAVLLAMFIASLLGAAITYVIPLYIEIVQGRSSIYTAVAIIPFALSGFVAAVLVVPLHKRTHCARIASYAFASVAFGAALLGAKIHNDWSNVAVVVGMSAVGAGEGALMTLLFKLLASRNQASDVGPLCGSTDYLAAGIGTSLASALIVGVLATSVQRELAVNPLLTPGLRSQIELDRVSFISNEQLHRGLTLRGVPPAEIEQSVEVNTRLRLHALKVCFFVFSGLALLALVPSASLPDFSGRSR